MRKLFLLPLFVVVLALTGCGERERTAILTAHGSGTEPERQGVVTYTDANGKLQTTSNKILPWSIKYPVRKGQKISVTVVGHSMARKYTVNISVGHDQDDRVDVASQRGPGIKKVTCEYRVP